MHASGLQVYSTQSCERASQNLHLLSDLKVLPRLNGNLGGHDTLQALDLFRGNFKEGPAASHSVDNSGRTQNAEAIVSIELAEHIAREQWQIDVLHAVRPLVTVSRQGQELPVSLGVEDIGNTLLVTRPYTQRKPRFIPDVEHSIPPMIISSDEQ